MILNKNQCQSAIYALELRIADQMKEINLELRRGCSSQEIISSIEADICNLYVVINFLRNLHEDNK